jgi:ssDNA-binding Zn-finger/Zn-ribbon topoisomerase 1
MYCPKCKKTIKADRMEKVDAELQRRFKNDSLSRGLCPVCSTPLVAPKRGE